MIRTILFDLGNVLAFFDHYRAIRPLSAYLPDGSNPATVYRDLYGSRIEFDYETGKLTSSQYFAAVRELTGIACDEATFFAHFGDIFTRNAGVCDWLPRLAGRYRLLAASNTNPGHTASFRDYLRDDLRYFDFQVLSYEVGERKPGHAFYAACQERAAALPSECLFLDDLAANVEAARAFGWNAERYSPGLDLGEVWEDYAILPGS